MTRDGEHVESDFRGLDDSVSPRVYVTSESRQQTQWPSQHERDSLGLPVSSCGGHDGCDVDQTRQDDEGAAAQVPPRRIPRARVSSVDETRDTAEDPGAPEPCGGSSHRGVASRHHLDRNAAGHSRCTQGGKEEDGLDPSLRGDLRDVRGQERHDRHPRDEGDQDHLRQHGAGGVEM